MKPVAGAIGVVLLLGLLTSLLLRAIETSTPAYEATLQAFDDFSLAEASLHRDVLQARAGLLHNYDSLGTAIEAMEAAVARLRSYAKRESLNAGPIDGLGATIAKYEDLIESFKSNNALLQNSLSYVGVLGTDPAFGGRDPALATQVGALAAAILHLARDTSSATADALQEQIDRFDAQAAAAGQITEAAQSLLAHARLLQGLLPAVDATLRSLASVPSRKALEATRTLFANHQAALEATAQRYRLLLYLTSLLLVVVLVRLGLRLRARAFALRQRAAFEHVIAENSTRLINCSPAETTARLDQVLAEFARAIGTERAYVVTEGSACRIHTWCADGAAYPPGWPVQASALFRELGSAETDILTIPDVTALPPGTARKTLEAAGIRGWACVPLMRPGRVQGIMGFDTFRPAWDKTFPLPVVRLASDAIINAIEREFLERDRATLATRLERARRMQMIGSLASGIAHNFNNIIGAILGYSEMVEPQLAPGSKSAQHVDEIRRAAERGRDLIDNILTFGRRRDTRIQPVRMRSLLEESAALLRASLPAGIDLIVADVAAGLAVSGEPAQLQQVILNLCTNAAQALEERGCIRVVAEARDVAAALALSHGNLEPGRFVRLSVIDNGHGFDESIARRLFEPFFTTRKAGTGLGLATVHEIVCDHGGTINVQSEPGHGSRFEAWFPALADRTEVMPKTALPLGRGETVLIVESERLLPDEEMLAALGYEPVGFERGEDAIVACRSTPDRFDAVLIGHTLAGTNDLQLAQTLHELMAQRPILFATASTNDVRVEELAQAGISEVLRRPLDCSELASVLSRCLRSTRLFY